MTTFRWIFAALVVGLVVPRLGATRTLLCAHGLTAVASVVPRPPPRSPPSRPAACP